MSDKPTKTAWRPIRTVPRDGRTVLIRSRKYGIDVANFPPEHAPGHWDRRRDGTWGGGATLEAEAATSWAEVPQ